MSTTLQKLWVHVHAQSFGLDGLPLSSWMRSSLQKNCWKRWFSVEEKTTQQSKQCKSTNVLHFPPPASSEDNWWAQNDHHRILPHSEFSYLPCFLQCSFWIESGVPFAPVNSWISFVLLRNIQATFIRLSIRSAMMLPPFDASVHLQAPATTRFKKVRDAENVISRLGAHLCFQFSNSSFLSFLSCFLKWSKVLFAVPPTAAMALTILMQLLFCDENFLKWTRLPKDLKTGWYMTTPLLPAKHCCLPCLIPMAPSPPAARMLRSCFTGIVLLLSRMDHFERDNCCIWLLDDKHTPCLISATPSNDQNICEANGNDPLNANPAFGFAATFLTQFHPGKREESKLYAVLSASDVHLMSYDSYAFISTDFALHLLCPGFLSQHSTFACFACLLLSSLLRRRRRERSDALWSPLSSPFTKCISREGKLKRKMCNFAAQSTETNKKRKSNFPLDGSADVGSALKQWLGCPVQQFQCNVRGPQRTFCMINAL